MKIIGIVPAILEIKGVKEEDGRYRQPYVRTLLPRRRDLDGNTFLKIDMHPSYPFSVVIPTRYIEASSAEDDPIFSCKLSITKLNGEIWQEEKQLEIEDTYYHFDHKVSQLVFIIPTATELGYPAPLFPPQEPIFPLDVLPEQPVQFWINCELKASLTLSEWKDDEKTPRKIEASSTTKILIEYNQIGYHLIEGLNLQENQYGLKGFSFDERDNPEDEWRVYDAAHQFYDDFHQYWQDRLDAVPEDL